MGSDLFLLPEWHPQEAILLAWPDQDTDWAEWLPSVQDCYLEIIRTITQNHCNVILLIRVAEVAKFTKLADGLSNVLLVQADYDDTWIRDYGFLTCQTDKGMQPVEYQFNGWGTKFDASRDNQINQRVLAKLCQHDLLSYALVCEGGALEIDQHRHLLTTAQCLLNSKRNGVFTLEQYRQAFAQQLGTEKVTILQNGHLQGDDTDGHIDTLVRFTPQQGLVIQSCYNLPKDQHFQGLSALVQECKHALPAHQIFELPLPVILNSQGKRLPASYANFLICNDIILCPIYQQPEDQQALLTLANAYPTHNIVPINAMPLIQQFGSIHCISMQVPAGTLKSDILKRFANGISLYE